MGRPNINRVFTKFPELPLELRLLIWKAALPGPRVITIREAPLPITVAQWNNMSGPEISAFNGSGFDLAVLHARMRNGMGPEHLWQLPDTLPDQDIQLLRELDVESWDICSIMDRDRSARLEFRQPIGDAIVFHLSQGIPIDVVQDYLGLTTEREVRLLVLITAHSRLRPYGMAAEIPSDELDPLLSLRLRRIRSDSRLETLQVCHESRAVTLQAFTKVFCTNASRSETYFNFEIDTLYIKSPNFSIALDPYQVFRNIPTTLTCISDTENVAKVRNVAILMHMDEDAVDVGEWLAQLLLYFSCIKTITLVLTDSDRYPESPCENCPCVFVDPESVEESLAGSATNKLAFGKDLLEEVALLGLPLGTAPTIELKVAICPRCDC